MKKQLLYTATCLSLMLSSYPTYAGRGSIDPESPRRGHFAVDPGSPQSPRRNSCPSRLSPTNRVFETFALGPRGESAPALIETRAEENYRIWLAPLLEGLAGKFREEAVQSFDTLDPVEYESFARFVVRYTAETYDTQNRTEVILQVRLISSAAIIFSLRPRVNAFADFIDALGIEKCLVVTTLPFLWQIKPSDYDAFKGYILPRLNGLADPVRTWALLSHTKAFLDLQGAQAKDVAEAISTSPAPLPVS